MMPPELLPVDASPRKVAVVLVDRANYGRLQPVMEQLQVHPQVELLTIVGGTMVLERFGKPMRIVEEDGFQVDAEVYQELEGSTPATMAKSIGFGVTEYANAFHRLRPDLVLLIGDRYEALAAAIAAAYMNLCLVHVQGGEVSGSIDESARHAITKFSHYHFPSTARAAEYIVRMGERPDTILGVGCPASDLARRARRMVDPAILHQRGAGAVIDPARPFLLTVYHPTTTEFGSEVDQIDQVLKALSSIRMPTVLLWPNIDAGSDRIAKRIRQFRVRNNTDDFMRTCTNLSPADYLSVLASAACLVGNSSSFVRDAGFFGTPVTLVGRRQEGREMGAHVDRVDVEQSRILASIRRQLGHGRYPPSTLYGDGFVAPRIAKAVATAPLYVQKRLHYETPETVSSLGSEQRCAS